jgi:hypothetical protein
LMSVMGESFQRNGVHISDTDRKFPWWYRGLDERLSDVLLN